MEEKDPQQPLQKPDVPPETPVKPEDDLKRKVNELIAQGLSRQDERTDNLLRTEIKGPIESTAPDHREMEADSLPKWLERFNRWHRRLMSDFVFMLWLSVVVGIVGGFAAFIFYRLVLRTSEIFMRIIWPDRLNWWLIFVPLVGILLSGIYTRYVVRTNLTHGVSRLMYSIYTGKFLLKRNLIYSPIIGGTITLGLGGSAGSAGLIAISGAAIGSNLGRWLRLQMPMVKVLIGCGAAAGISGIFQSPVGGLLFTLEFLKLELGTFSILAVTLSSLSAYGLVFLLNGCVVPTLYLPDGGISPDQYWSVLALGIFCGLYSLYYTQAIYYCDKFFKKINNPWYRNIIGGLFVGVCLMLFPALYGEGYPLMSHLIHSDNEALVAGDIFDFMHLGSWGMIIISGCVLLLKGWATGTCNASGGVSSDFAPTIYAGAISGFFFATFCNTAFHTEFSVPLFILLGMAAVMSGCIEAPMMSIFIIMNMGTDLAFLLAIIIASFSSYITVRVGSHIRGFDSKLVRHLQWFSDLKRQRKALSPAGAGK